jgi:anti-sigma factor RsiW
MNSHLSADEIIDYIRHELAPAEDVIVFEHLALCEPCRSEHEAELQLTSALRATLGSERELPAMLKARIWDEIRTPRRAATPWAAFWRPIAAAGLTAAVAAGAYVAVSSNAAPKTPQVAVDARYYFASHSATTRQENPLADHSAPIINAVEAADSGAASSPSLQVIEAGDEPALQDAPSR